MIMRNVQDQFRVSRLLDALNGWMNQDRGGEFEGRSRTLVPSLPVKYMFEKMDAWFRELEGAG